MDDEEKEVNLGDLKESARFICNIDGMDAENPSWSSG